MDNAIAVDARTASGSAQNRRLRLTGQVPAVVFGKGRESLSVQVEAKAFETLYRAAGRTTLVNLTIDGETTSAIIKSVQRNPLTGRALHVDFFLVDLKQEMEVEVPLVFTGVAPAIEEFNGTLMTPISQIRVRALPAEMPHEITVDISPLVDLEGAIHVSDLVVPDNVHIQADPEDLLARILPPRVEEEPEVEEEAAEEGAEGAEGSEGAAPTSGEAGGGEATGEGESEG